METVFTAKSSGSFQDWVYFLTLFLILNVGGTLSTAKQSLSVDRRYGVTFLFALSIQAEQRL